MNAVVNKFGGSSVADTDKIMKIALKLKKRVVEGTKVIAVVSAMGKTTDGLISLAKEISTKPDAREMDMLLTTGEQVSVALLSMALNEIGIKSKSLTGFQAEILTTEDHNEAKIQSFNNEKIVTLLQEYDVLVVAGFQGVTEDNEITTLGRGGSDTSAVALAAALGINCEIYSDVAGIYTCDPKLHPSAKKIKYISYDEMLEMTGLGAKVLHSRAVEIAKKFGITIYCGSTFSNEEGSYVVDENQIIEQPVVTGISVMENQAQVTIKQLPLDYTLVHSLFEKVAQEGLNVDMISIINYENSLAISFSIVQDQKNELKETINLALNDLENYDIEYKKGYVKVSVVGIGMKSSSGVASRFFKAIEKIPAKLVTTSEIKISALVGSDYKNSAVEALVNEFQL